MFDTFDDVKNRHQNILCIIEKKDDHQEERCICD